MAPPGPNLSTFGTKPLYKALNLEWQIARVNDFEFEIYNHIGK